MRARSLALPLLLAAACAPPPPPPSVAVHAPPPSPGAPSPEDAPVTVSHRAAIAAQASSLRPVWRDGVLLAQVHLWPSVGPAGMLFEVEDHFGSPLFLLPGGDIRSLDVSETGKLFQPGETAAITDLTGGQVRQIGPWTGARFFDQGKKLYVWSGTKEGVWDLEADRLLVERPLDGDAAGTGAHLHGDPPRVIREGEAFLRISELPSLRPVLQHDAIYRCLAPGAEAVLSFTSEPWLGSKPWPGTGEQTAVYQRLVPPGKPIKRPIPFLSTLPSACAFDLPRDRVAWAMGGIQVLDAASPRVRTLVAGELPDHERYAIYGLTYTADGQHLCAEQEGHVTAYRTDGGKPLLDTPFQTVHCFRGGAGAVVARIPGTKGYERWPSLSGLYFRRFTEALGPDMTTAAVVQIEKLPAGRTEGEEVKRKLVLVLAEVPGGKVRHRIVIGEAMESELAMFDVTFTHAGKTVCARGGPISVAYNVDSGQPVPVPELPPQGTPDGELRGGLEITYDTVRHAASGAVIPLGAPRFSEAHVDGAHAVFSGPGGRLLVDLARSGPLAASAAPPSSPDAERDPAEGRPSRVHVDGSSIVVRAAPGQPEREIPFPWVLRRGAAWRGALLPRGDRLLLWSAEALLILDGSGALLATVVPASRESAVAFFPSGRHERLGRAGPEDGLFCHDGWKLVPLAACARDLEVSGRLARLLGD